jgi:hypothetical protein
MESGSASVLNIWLHAYVESLADPEKQSLGLPLNELGDSVINHINGIHDRRDKPTNEALLKDYRAVEGIIGELGVQLREAEKSNAGDREPLLKAMSAFSELSALIKDKIGLLTSQKEK